MRLFLGSLPLLLLGLLVNGCTTVSPDECWPNTSGGFGGSGTIPIGAGVGATTGGDYADPSRVPLDKGGEPYNPCVTPSDKSDPPKSDAPVEASLKVFCSKPDHGSTCSERCMNKGLACVPIALHPYKSNGGTGKLFSCNDPLFGTMCGYHYPNGDDCYYYFGFPHPPFCAYSGDD